MTITNQQVIRLKQMLVQNNQEISSAKSGMSSKTARKYIKSGKLPSELKKQRYWKTRSNVFEEELERIELMLEKSPGLEAKTILNHLIELDSSKYKLSHERTLQRIIRKWRSINGADRAVIFCQSILPGKQSQSDYTSMNDIGITINRKGFNHLLFHFILPYSRWEHVSVCHSESFASLTTGYEEAVWSLGYVAPEHRTDNLSAASKSKGKVRVTTDNWQEFIDYYGVTASRNNPGVSHENGSIEKSHDLLKSAIKQQLMLRGSKNFTDLKDYKQFLEQLIISRNGTRRERLLEETKLLKSLPSNRYYAPVIVEFVVSRSSTIRLDKVIYSVPSRLIGYKLRAYTYREEIELYYGQTLVQKMPKISKELSKVVINYRHIINSLIRKPGAFENYQYREFLFPSTTFRVAYDNLSKHYPANGVKQYLKLLQMAAMNSESEVETALELLINHNTVPSVEEVKKLIRDNSTIQVKVNVRQPSITEYDLLLNKTA